MKQRPREMNPKGWTNDSKNPQMNIREMSNENFHKLVLFMYLCFYNTTLTKEFLPLAWAIGLAFALSSHPGFWAYFFCTNRERSEEIKREFFLCKGRFPYSCVLLRFWNTLGLMPSSVLLQEPRQQRFFVAFRMIMMN
jgi:hypothetical protein